MKLFIVRHGETKENAQKIMQGHLHGTLTELGLKQAKEVAKKLKNTKFDHIYSSDLQRAIDTAEIIKGSHPDTPLTFTKELREVNLGEFQGKRWDEVDWDGLGKDRMERKPKGGESLNELRKRIVDFIAELYKTHKNSKVLIVTHGGVIRQTISYFGGYSTEDIMKEFQHYSIKNGAIIKLRLIGERQGKLLNLSDVFK